MKVYIAGKLCDESERAFIEKVANLVESEGFETFVPHRDVGLAKGMIDVKEIFEGDIIKGFQGCGLIVAILDGLHVGAGTSWELGYAYAKGIPAIGLKTEEPVEDALDQLSAILIASMPIATSLEELKKKLQEFKNKSD